MIKYTYPFVCGALTALILCVFIWDISILALITAVIVVITGDVIKGAFPSFYNKWIERASRAVKNTLDAFNAPTNQWQNTVNERLGVGFVHFLVGASAANVFLLGVMLREMG